MNGIFDQLSADAFYSASAHAQDLNTMFHSGWHLVAFDFEFQRAGDYQVIQLGKQSWILCQEGDELVAFANICRHRGHPIAEGSGHLDSFTCPYHRWRYNLDGTLQRAPNENAVESFDAQRICLPKASVFIASPLVFISPNEEAPSTEQCAEFTALAQKVAEVGPKFSRLNTCNERSYTIDCNWKVAVDNYLECYHCGGGHPSFCDIMKLRSYAGDSHSHWTYQRADYCGDVELAENTPASWGFFTCFPANIINITPGLNQINLMRILPTGPNTCRVDLRTWFSNSADTKIQDLMNSIILEVKSEDIVFCEAVQRGLESGQIERGVIMDDPKSGASSERAVRQFRDWLVNQNSVV